MLQLATPHDLHPFNALCYTDRPMKDQGSKPPHLVLIQGGDEALGPISRDSLWPTAEDQAPFWAVALFWTTKALLFGSMLYFLFG